MFITTRAKIQVATTATISHPSIIIAVYREVFVVKFVIIEAYDSLVAKLVKLRVYEG